MLSPLALLDSSPDKLGQVQSRLNLLSRHLTTTHRIIAFEARALELAKWDFPLATTYLGGVRVVHKKLGSICGYAIKL